MTHSHTSNQYVSTRVLKLNVGFILAEGPGFSRETRLDIPQRLRVSDDLLIEGLSGNLRITRISEGILVQGVLECTRLTQCTRCLEDTTITLPMEVEELYVLDEDSDSSFTIGEDGILDLAPLIREEALISTPLQVLCQSGCQGLCPECGQNLNTGTCDCDLDQVDPRWAALAGLQKRLADSEA